MRNALGELRRLLAPVDASSGVVVSSSVGTVKVATRAGLVTARAAGSLSRGDRVTIAGGVASAAPAASASYPV